MEGKASPPVVGFWGPVTASIDWCEGNYEVSYYVAEWWNTLSNCGLMFLPLVTLWYMRKYGLPGRYAAVTLSYSIIGLGSALFHATLLFYMQLADELPMLWGSLITLHALLECRPKPKYPWLPFALSAFGVLWTLASPWTHRDYPLLFEGLFLIIEGACFYLTLTLVMKSKNNIVRITFVAQCLFAIVAFAFWVADNAYCSQIRSSTIGRTSWFRHFGSLHGYWHLLMAWHILCGVSVTAYSHAVMLNMQPELKWKWGIPQVLPTRRVSQKPD